MNTSYYVLSPISRIHIHSPELRIPTKSVLNVQYKQNEWDIIRHVQLFNMSLILMYDIHKLYQTYPVIIEVGNVTALLPLPRKAHGNFSSIFPGSRSRISIV